MWLATATLLTVAGGLALLIAGLRRTRRGTEPHCRACDFSLSGLGAVPREGLLCPECGKPVTETSHVSIGTRARRPRLALGGAAVLAVGLLIATLLVSALSAKGAALVPTIILVPQATLTSFSTPSVVMELDKRLNAGDLSSGQKQTLTEAALTLQKQRGAVSPEVAELLFDLLGSMTDEQCRRFVDQTLRLQLHTPPLLRENGTLLLICDARGMSSVTGRRPIGGPGDTAIDCRLVEARLGNTPLLRGMDGRDPYAQHGVMPADLTSPGMFGAYFRFELTAGSGAPSVFPVGPSNINTTWEFRAIGGDRKRNLAWRIERSQPITIVPATADDYTPVNDEQSRTALQKTLATIRLSKGPGPPGALFVRHDGELPVDVAFEVRAFDADGKPVLTRPPSMTYDQRNRVTRTTPTARLDIPADTKGPLRLELVPIKPSNMNNVFGRVWTGEPFTVENVKLPQ